MYFLESDFSTCYFVRVVAQCRFTFAATLAFLLFSGPGRSHTSQTWRRENECEESNQKTGDKEEGRRNCAQIVGTLKKRNLEVRKRKPHSFNVGSCTWKSVVSEGLGHGAELKRSAKEASGGECGREETVGVLVSVSVFFDVNNAEFEHKVAMYHSGLRFTRQVSFLRW